MVNTSFSKKCKELMYVNCEVSVRCADCGAELKADSDEVAWASNELMLLIYRYKYELKGGRLLCRSCAE